MATDKKLAPNIDNSDLVNFPNGRIRDNSGSGDGTPVNRLLYSDIHEFFGKLMRLAAIAYNGLPESEGNTYQLVDAIIALAGKNDFVASLNTSGGVLQISALKLSILKNNEALICKAAVNYAGETTIAGIETGVTKTVTVPSAYQANDYLRLINTGSGITLVRLADALNLDVLTAALAYLKATTNAVEFTGSSTTVATTPSSNKAAFTRRVNGADSGTYLASHTQNGLLSAAQWDIINGIPANPVKNVGWFSGVDPGGGTVGSGAPVSGDITSAIITHVEPGGYPYGGSTTYRCTVAHAMANTNYFVRLYIMSEGTMEEDNNMWCPVFRPVSTTQFDFSLQEGAVGTQSLKIHCEVVQIS